MNLKRILNKQYKLIGEYKKFESCRFCNSKIQPVISLGTMPLAGGFLEKKNLGRNELYYPLSLGFCKKCFMLQTIEAINASTLFEKYYYSSSKIKTLSNHFKLLATEISSLKPKFVVEIGSNDGVLIQALVKSKVNALGVDPARNIVEPKIKKGVPLLCDYFNLNVSKKIVERYGKADVIASSNTMAHIENISDVYKGIKILLSKKGICIIEVHSLAKIINEFQYDMIYHEHLYYYSARSMIEILKLYGLELFDIKEIPMHAGSYRFYIQHKNGPRKKTRNISKILENEKKLGLSKIETYISYNLQMKKQKQSLIKLLEKLKSNNKRIVGYGASGRGNTVMGYSNIDDKLLDAVIDDSPLKQGRYTPGNRLQIVKSGTLLTKKRADYVLLFAWSFADEIIKKNSTYIKNGGKFIIPLPKVTTLP